MSRIIRAMFVVVCVLLVAQTNPTAQTQPVLAGTVVDTLGARLAGATVTLLRDGQKVQDGKSDSEGAFSFSGLS
ncbi:MAG TPA: carboxypeptidase-like regulatory domain-containing protein, partial [Vicinamibacterales bacterium]|nr:carboxypeptidase-like regulatory domain-containing protein [Vicinamibacterales bacterium]